MKKRKRVLAILLAGFLSVTTAFQTTATVAFATDSSSEATSLISSEEQPETEESEAGESSSASEEDNSSKDAATEGTSAKEESEAAAEEVSLEASSQSTETEGAEEATEAASEASSTDSAALEASEEVDEETVAITTIKEVLDAASGEFTVKGVVNYVSGRNVYVQDDTAALCAYLSKADSTIKVGNMLTVTGTYKSYNGLAELDKATVVENDTDNTFDYGYTVIEASEFKDFVANYNDYECKKVIIKGVTVTSVAAKKVYVAYDGTSALIYGSGLDTLFADYPAGTVVDLTTVVCDYNGIELLPISDDEHQAVSLSEQEEEDDDTVTVDDSVTLSIASWAGSSLASYAGNMEVYGDAASSNDCADTDNVLTAVVGGTGVSPVYNVSKDSYIIGSKGMSTDGYYQLAIAGKGYGSYKLSFTMRGSNTGAKNWKASYSTDGVGFTDFSDVFVVSTTAAEYSLELPADVMHAERLYIRIQPSENLSIKGAEIGTGGVNRFYGIAVTGSPVKASDMTAFVTALPEAGEVPMGQEITLETSTKDATIYYTLNGSDVQTYDADNKPILTEESFVTESDLDAVKKATLEAYAVAEGKSDSVKVKYVYTVAQVATVSVSPNGGAIRKGTNVILKTATEGATIYYSFDNGETFTEYTEQIKISELPCTLTTKASCDGYADSAVYSVNFTERINEEYNIYFGQLHSHTSYSDGAGTAEEAFLHASTEVENLDFLAVTDHSNSYDNDTSVNITDGSASTEWVEGHELAKKYTSDEFVGLFGYEMTWSGGAPGHMNTFNTGGFMSRNMTGYESQSRVALQNYYAQLVNTPESISMFNHPGTTFGDFYDFAYYSEANDQQITLIEVGNGEGAIGSSGYFPSYEYYTRALDKGWHVAPANNQDNHKGRWGDANTGRTVILADSLTEENIYDAIRNMRVYATEDNDLNIYYTMNGLDMGTVMDEVPSEVNIKVKTSDATDSSTMTMEVIVNGGLTVASASVSEAEAVTEFTLSPDYSYYYIKITQADGDIAVTAPIWLSNVEAVGISSISTDASLAVAGEALDINTVLYNNEATDFEVSSIVYTANGEVIHTTDVSGDFAKIASQGELTDSFSFLCDSVGKQTIEVTLIGYLGGASKKYTASMDITYISPDMVTHVIVDGTHNNDYVTGYYGGNVGNFADIAAAEYVKVDVVTTEITEEMLDNCAVLVVSAPSKKSGTYNNASYSATHFEDSFIELIKNYVAQGGNLITCGIADYSDSKETQSSTEINKLLEAIGATTRLNSDEMCDDDSNGGQNYRLYFSQFNRDSYLVKDVTSTQTYSAYSGASVILNEEAVAAGTAEGVVYGHSTTYSLDTKQYDDNYVAVDKGNVVAMARENLNGGGQLIVTGTVFLSDFEVKTDLDYGGQEYYANRNILLNFLEETQKEIPVSTIAEMRQGNAGDIFTIEGYVTAGTAVEGNIFFDTIYVQDDTAGTTVFPIADSGIEVGTKLRITGYVDGYQGDKEIQIYSYKVLDDEPYVYAPKEVTTKEAADYDALGGSLLKVEGTVTNVVTNSSGVDYFYVMDDSGVEARVFIDGYILASDGNDTIAEDAVVGNVVSAIGLSYYNPDGACLRVRDRAEIELVEKAPEVVLSLVTKWGTTYCVDQDGNKVSGFQTVDGKDYYFNAKGAMQKSAWITVDDVTYYTLSDGQVAKGTMVTKWGSQYIFDETGALQIGFAEYEGNTYYCKPSKGVVQKSTWITVDDKKYYAKSDGILAKNETITKWGKKYSFDEDGVLID